MMRSMFGAAVLALTFAVAACAGAQAHGDPALRAQAHVSAEQAQRTALAARAGTVKEWELEREAGGSGLRYSFVITQQGHDYEVGVDAGDGSVLENTAEGANPD